jgi:DNA-binding transcriptional LysR family regulator
VRAQGNSALVDAGNTYRDAVKSASQQAEDSFKQVAKQAESAAESLRGALEGSFNLLTPQLQKSLLSDARRDINQAISAGFFNPGAVALQTGSVEGILDVANKARGIDRANEQLASVTTELVSVNSNLTQVTGDLVKKDWTVNVAVDATTGASEVQLG